MSTSPPIVPALSQGGTVTGNLTVTGTIPAGPNAGPLPELQAATPVAGFALQNATPTVISWTAPNDGLLHRATIYGMLNVTTTETGGAVSVQFTDPAGNTHTSSLYGGGTTAPASVPPVVFTGVVKAGSTVSVLQASALTVGAATLWAEIWGS